MALLVKKFGGTSVGNIKRIKNIASSICHSKEAGNEIVIVVSAMGQTIDDLNSFKVPYMWDSITGEKLDKKDPFGSLYFNPIFLLKYFYNKRLNNSTIAFVK